MKLLYDFYVGDCHDSAGHKNRCVTGAIYNYTMQLASAYQNTNLKLHCKHSISMSLESIVAHDIT